MSDKKTIRIVKKDESTSATDEPKANSAGESKGSLVGTVTSWVTEFQEKRRSETANALRILSSGLSEKP